MEGPHDDPGATSFSAPPGCGFHPSQQQLLSYYLTKKNNLDGRGGSDGCDLIGELDLYHYDPFELPDRACFSYGYGAGKMHWYCYARRNTKESEAGRRKTKSGYWRRRRKVRDVVGTGGGGKVVLGTRSSFVFCLKNPPKNEARTDWVMHEYALPDHLKASFVLFRVFVKSRRGNSIMDNGLSSCAEETVSAVRHIGIQHNGFLTPDILEAKMHDDNSVCVASIPHQLGMQPRELVSLSVLPGSSAKVFEGLTDQQALSILEADFIELDDLV